MNLLSIPCQSCGRVPTVLMHVSMTPIGILCRIHADALMSELATTVPEDEARRGWALWCQTRDELFGAAR